MKSIANEPSPPELDPVSVLPAIPGQCVYDELFQANPNVPLEWPQLFAARPFVGDVVWTVDGKFVAVVIGVGHQIHALSGPILAVVLSTESIKHVD